MPAEDDRLRKAVATYGTGSWPSIAREVGTRTTTQCQGRHSRLIDSARFQGQANPGRGKPLQQPDWTDAADQWLLRRVAEVGERWAQLRSGLLDRRAPPHHPYYRTSSSLRRRYIFITTATQGHWQPDEVERLRAAMTKQKAQTGVLASGRFPMGFWTGVAAKVFTRSSDQCTKYWCAHRHQLHFGAAVVARDNVKSGHPATKTPWSVAEDVRLLLGPHRQRPHLLEDMPVYAELCRRVEEAHRADTVPSQEPNAQVQSPSGKPLAGGDSKVWTTLVYQFPGRIVPSLAKHAGHLRLQYHRIPTVINNRAAARLLHLRRTYGPRYRLLITFMGLDLDWRSMRALVRFCDVRQALVDRIKLAANGSSDRVDRGTQKPEGLRLEA
ncbi:hypothetical protein IWQ60_011881 [Tieghemiomyces parasiticus]|uniref:Myb-like domain-containing protein n=1 Tax=Tieghemiomyces parasiticus TaxID=78921 RepID=A0A9W8DLV4_9FUNG|nr:hypothetical protein IWQ60_011881 [Tieghemiomyces parasiticus]